MYGSTRILLTVCDDPQGFFLQSGSTRILLTVRVDPQGPTLLYVWILKDPPDCKNETRKTQGINQNATRIEPDLKSGLRVG